MRKIVLYGHGGACNHGAEAIVRASVPLFRRAGVPILLSTHFSAQDCEFGLDQLVDRLIQADLSRIPAERERLDFAGRVQAASEIYRDALAQIDGDTICIGIGGDNYCYPNWHRQSVFHETAKRLGGKSVLWGCSIQPEMIDQRMEELLRAHDCIYVRESLTAQALRAHGAAQVVLLPDPAFLLPPEPCPLPDGFRPHTAALNISPMLLRRSGGLMDHFLKTARLLLERADALLLLPHVLMPSDNDQDALEELEQLLSPRERARVCWADSNLNAAQRKYLLSQCELLVCCRTHASIAGYSTGVPTLVLGYSVKAQGIALDLGMENWVLSAQEGALLPEFAAELWDMRGEVRCILQAEQARIVGKYDA